MFAAADGYVDVVKVTAEPACMRCFDASTDRFFWNTKPASMSLSVLAMHRFIGPHAKDASRLSR